MIGTSSAAAPSHGSPAFGNFVRSRSPQLQFCYEDTRASTPYLAGSATIADSVHARLSALPAEELQVLRDAAITGMRDNILEVAKAEKLTVRQTYERILPSQRRLAPFARTRSAVSRRHCANAAT